MSQKLALTFRIFKNDQLIREDTLVSGVIKIGKVPSAHLRIDDESVSRMHAIVEVTGGDVSLIDLGSTRGTYVNGRRINKAKLESGDVITLGDTRVEIAIAEAPAVRPISEPSVIVAADAVPAPADVATSAPRPRPATAAPPPLPAATMSVPAAMRPASAAPPPVPAATSPMAAAVPLLNAAPPVRAAAAAAHVATSAVLGAAPAMPAGVPPLLMQVPPVASGVPAAVPQVPAAPPGARALPLDTAANPALFQRAMAESADELGGARAVEVAAMLGDSVIGVKHCIDPRSGKVTPATWGWIAAGSACLVASAIAFVASVSNAADNQRALETWTRIQHRPPHAFRPYELGAGIDWVAFGGLALGLVGLTFGLVRIRSERTSPYYRIGTAPGVELAVDSAPQPAFPLIAPSGDDFVFNYADGIDGELITDGKSTPLAELATAGRSRPSTAVAGAIEVPIPARARIRARTGQTTFVVSAVARPRRHATPLFANLENRALSYLAGSLAVHLAFWGLLQLIPPDAAGVSIAPGTTEDTGMRAGLIARIEPPPEKVDDPGDSGGPSVDSAPMPLPEGAAGNPDKQTDGRMHVAHTEDRPHLSRDEAIAIAIREGVLGSEQLLSGVKALSETSPFASGFDLDNINGAIYGADGGGRGNFGGGVHGFDLGGGCSEPPCGTIGLTAGAPNTIGGRRGDNYRLPRERGLDGGHGHTPVLPHIGEPVTRGAGYDKAIIRRYIRRRINEIAYCYEKQLLAHPDLVGEVAVTFLISPTGTVQSASGKGFDPEVSSCVAGVILTIQFPAPGDGGAVQVNYPFNFHAAGR